MVSSVYKWFGSTVFSIFLFMNGNIQLPATAFSVAVKVGLHPFHVSVVELEHNSADGTLEISCKIFTDDFETILAKNYNAKVDLTNPPNKAAMDSLVKKYINSHLSFRANGKPVILQYIGFEVDKEAAYGYVEVENVPSVNKIDITNTILFDKFDDQVNIMHIKVNGDRKSTRLNYPDKEVSFSF